MMLNMQPTYRAMLGDVDRFRLLLVGAGGTGSQLALALAGLMHHAREKGIAIDLTLVDPDHVEPQNVGRQAFGPHSAQLGLNKAVDVATRLNCAYGLEIAAWPVAYTEDLGRTWFEPYTNTAHLIIGCVDNTPARQALAQTVANAGGRIWALDAGNERYSGQVLLGNISDATQIEYSPLGVCSGFPSPYVQEPTLLEETADETEASCALLVQREEQALSVNRMTAAIAAHLCTVFVLEREVRQMGAYFGLEPLGMRNVQMQ